MIYFPLFNVCFDGAAAIMEHELCRAGQAVIDPPHRDGGYRVIDRSDDHGNRLYVLLFRRACSMAARRGTRY